LNNFYQIKIKVATVRRDAHCSKLGAPTLKLNTGRGGPSYMQGYSVEYPNFLAKKLIHIVYIYVYVPKKEINKSKWIVCEEFSPKTLLLPPSVLTRWSNISIRPNTACISLSSHQMAQQPNTIQIMLIYAQLCATYLLYIMLHSKKHLLYIMQLLYLCSYTCQILCFHSQKKKLYTFIFWIPTLKILGPPLNTVFVWSFSMSLDSFLIAYQ
jgi:hypothetical protein